MQINNSQSSYRQILQATSIFGGVQFVNIIIGIIRSKFVAILLGPLGMGIYGLLTTTIAFINTLTGFGLSTSAVRDIAAAYSTGNKTRVAIITSVFRRWVWVTGILGTITTLILAPWLSQITFGNKDYTLAFMLISITLLLTQISVGQSVLLRGLRKINYLAKAGVIGSVLGLITTVPMYYFWGLKGIVPAIILTSFTTLLLTWYYARRLGIKSIYVSKARTLAEGRGMLRLGFVINLSSLLALGASYIVRLFISNTGGVEEVGLYNAGFAIIFTYVGMIFTAMGTDYYPRLSAVAHSNELSRAVMNQQAEIALLILAPIIVVFLTFINWVIIILYSTKFLPVGDMILYAALGTFFKAASWSVAHILPAKGASKLFFWNELAANIYLLGFNLAGYYWWGLTGLGISFLLGYFVYFFQVFIIARIKYSFAFTSGFYKIFFVQLALASGCFVVVKQISSPYSYLAGIVFIIASCIHALNELDNRIGMKTLLLQIKKRFK
jgi:O-antigen/teichoic acid export membrane protein